MHSFIPFRFLFVSELMKFMSADVWDTRLRNEPLLIFTHVFFLMPVFRVSPGSSYRKLRRCITVTWRGLCPFPFPFQVSISMRRVVTLHFSFSILFSLFFLLLNFLLYFHVEYLNFFYVLHFSSILLHIVLCDQFLYWSHL